MKTATLKPTLRCLRCGYSWTPRGDVEPERIKSCPDCKHRKWKEPKPSEDEPRIFENLVSGNVVSEQSKMQKQEPIPIVINVPREQVVNIVKPFPWEPTEELTGSREYDQYRKAKMKREQQSTEKPEPRPEPCHDCGEDGEYSIDATDLNFTDQGTEFISYKEWFCAECYQRRTRNQ